MTAFHDELMKFIEPSLPTTYMAESRDSNQNISASMTKRFNELLLGDDLKGPPVVELGRITYKSSGASMYIPREIVRALNLDKEKDAAFVIFSIGNDEFFLIKDTALAQRVKPEILDRRRRLMLSAN
jgi:hypothetical protein